MQALLFGSIGTLVETSELQRRAFNQAFEDDSLDWNWDKHAYQTMLEISGGQNRLRHYAQQHGHALSDADIRNLHQKKSQHFQDMLHNGVELRPGVSRLMTEARDSGVKLGLVSATSHANIEAIATGARDLSLADFNVVMNASKVSQSKPSPEVYERACRELDVRSTQAVAIEDTTLSLQAARAANIVAIATPGAYTSDQDFSEAQAVFSHLGTKSDPSPMIRTEFAFEQDYVDINWLSKLLQKSQGIFA
jgi:HAD superfamily hydrolase (TIGR01509 family)